MKTFSIESEIELSHARMWRGHDLRHLQITNCWNAGMLATANRTGANIPNIPEGIRDPGCSQNTPAKVTAGPISPLNRVQYKHRAEGTHGLRQNGLSSPAYKKLRRRDHREESISIRQTDRQCHSPSYISSGVSSSYCHSCPKQNKVFYYYSPLSLLFTKVPRRDRTRC